jgi:hypothetical protein
LGAEVLRQRWRPRGRLLAEPPPWAASHLALPIAARDHLYFCSRDEAGRARPGRVTLRAEDDETLRCGPHAAGPLLDLGPLGAFDDAGVTTSCVVHDGPRTLLYYTGWMLGRSVPFYLSAGLAVSDDGGASFIRASPAPILERSAVDPFMTASPWVLRDGRTWRMWYVSCDRWDIVDGAPKHWYHVRYAESDDGVAWRREGRVAIDFADPDEYAIARPCVIREGDRYRMWFSARGTAYRLGYAESADGLSWHRDDGAVGLEPAPDGFDAEMQAYPCLAEVGGGRHLLYNGDGYGRTGIGYATAL